MVCPLLFACISALQRYANKSKTQYMEWINVIIGAVCGLIGALGGGSVLFFRQNKALKKIEVERSQSMEWERLYNEEVEKLKASEERCYDLYKQRKDLYEQNMERNVENANLRVDLATKDVAITHLQYCKCEIDECTRRQPPRKYSTKKTTTKKKTNNGTDTETQAQ